MWQALCYKGPGAMVTWRPGNIATNLVTAYQGDKLDCPYTPVRLCKAC